MPLLVGEFVVPPTDDDIPPESVEPVSGEPVASAPVAFVDVTWLGPDGTELALMHEGPGAGVHVMAGGDGFGAAPRAVTTRPLARGGAFLKWSHAEQRLITLPLSIQADTHEEFMALRRQVAKAFLATTPPAGIPSPGMLTVRRSDGQTRDIYCVYMEGLSWGDDSTNGVLMDRPVLQLLATDPWWYGQLHYDIKFEAAPTLNYMSPYETVSPSQTLGTTTLNVEGDVAASPVWTITGPASSVTITAGSESFTFGAIDADETITVDTDKYTVTDNTGTNRIGDLSWPSSKLFTMQPGLNELTLSISGGVSGESSIRLSYRPRWETA